MLSVVPECALMRLFWGVEDEWGWGEIMFGSGCCCCCCYCVWLIFLLIFLYFIFYFIDIVYVVFHLDLVIELSQVTRH